MSKHATTNFSDTGLIVFNKQHGAVEARGAHNSEVIRSSRVAAICVEIRGIFWLFQNFLLFGNIILSRAGIFSMPILLKVFRRFFHSHKQMTDVLRKALGTGRCVYFKLSDPPFRAPGSSVSLASAKTMFGPPEIERSCVSSLVMIVDFTREE